MQFTSLDQSAKRGDFDIGLSGIEDIPARRQSLAASIPYYEFREVLTVREGDRDRYRSLADLKGKRVATLGGTIAYDLLLEAERTHGITAVSYDDDVHPYSDLVLGRVDAVVLDNVLADRAMRRNAGLFTHPEALAVGHYIVITAPENTALRDQVDQILRDAMRDGTLEAIFRKWNVWNDDQPRLYERVFDPGRGQSRHPTWHLRHLRHFRHLEFCPSLRSVAVPGRAHHAGAVVRRDGAGRRARCADRDRPRLWRSASRTAADRLCRSDARHAGAAAAVRDLLRPGVGDQAAGVHRRPARPWAELRRL